MTIFTEIEALAYKFSEPDPPDGELTSGKILRGFIDRAVLPRDISSAPTDRRILAREINDAWMIVKWIDGHGWFHDPLLNGASSTMKNPVQWREL